MKNIDETLDWVKKSGGKVAAEKSPVGDMRFKAYIYDIEGNTIGLGLDAGR